MPVLCVAKVEAEHVMRAFELGAEGVFIAGCGAQCARENTADWVRERVRKVRRTLSQIGISPGYVQTFLPDGQSDPTQEMDKFVEQMVGSYLDSVLKQEVKK